MYEFRDSPCMMRTAWCANVNGKVYNVILTRPKLGSVADLMGVPWVVAS